MPGLMFDDEIPSRKEAQAQLRTRMRTEAEREQREIDARNLELIHNDPQLRRLMTAYRQLDQQGRDIVMYTAEELARGVAK